MKPSEIYRKAAKLIESGKSCRACFAIHSAAADPEIGGALRRRYVDDIIRTEFTGELYPGYEDSKRAMDERVVALCLMACLAEDAEKSMAAQ